MSYPGKYMDGSLRQLRDLTIKPTKTDPRPLFADTDLPPDYPDLGKSPPFRMLRWHPTTGEEVCALNQSEVNSYDHQGYVKYPPHQGPPNLVAAARDELAGLSPDDRQRVLAAVHKQKLEAIQSRLTKLSDAELSEIQAPGRKTA